MGLLSRIYHNSMLRT